MGIGYNDPGVRDEDTGNADTGGREKSNDHLKIETSKNLNEQKHIRRFVNKYTNRVRRGTKCNLPELSPPALPVLAKCYLGYE